MRPVHLAALAVTACAVALSHPTSALADTQSELRALNAAEVAAILARDQAKLGGLWADDFIVTNPFNALVRKPQVLALMSAGVFQFASLERTIEYIHDYGEFAVVAGSETGTWGGHSPMTGKLSHFRFTTVWRHGDRGWIEVARHANIVPPTPPAPH